MINIFAFTKNCVDKKMFLFPPTKGYNIDTWILLTVKGKEQFLMQRLKEPIDINFDEWELKENYAFPSALMTEFLRLDFNDENVTPKLF